MSSLNTNTVPNSLHIDILIKFPKSWQEKLKRYTAEELFYFYKLCLVKPRSIRDSETKEVVGISNIFLLTLKSKFYRWVEGTEKYPIHGDTWIKLAHKYRKDFTILCEEYYQREAKENENLIRIKDLEIAASRTKELSEVVNMKRIS